MRVLNLSEVNFNEVKEVVFGYAGITYEVLRKNKANAFNLVITKINLYHKTKGLYKVIATLNDNEKIEILV